MSVVTFFKKIHIFQVISFIGFTIALVSLIMLMSRNSGTIGDSTFSEEGVVESEVAGLQSVGVEDFVNSIALEGVENFNGQEFVYTETNSGFVLEDSEPFQAVSGAEFRLPFYWQELYQGDVFVTDVEVFVVNESFDDFVSGIRYGLGDGFVNEHQVRGVQRTTGFENSFVHQAYIDLENGTTLVFELRDSASEYPLFLSNYIAGMNLL